MTDTILAGRIRALAEDGGQQVAVVKDHRGRTVAHQLGPNALPALADLVEAVTLRHWPQDGRDCAECGDEWPCPTATALDALADALEVA